MRPYKHTGGPWACSATRESPRHLVVAITAINDGELVSIARLESNAAVPSRVTLANAKLIAASPDLLAALVNLIEKSDALTTTKGATAGRTVVDSFRIPASVIAVARRVIRKANKP